MILGLAVPAGDLRRHCREMEDFGEVESLRLPMLDALLRVEQISAADQILELSDAELCHQVNALLQRRRRKN